MLPLCEIFVVLLVEILKTDPLLAYRMYFGPCAPYQYRLTGPGAWPGARDAILTLLERVEKPFKTRTVAQKCTMAEYKLLLVAVAFVLLSLFVWQFI